MTKILKSSFVLLEFILFIKLYQNAPCMRSPILTLFLQYIPSSSTLFHQAQRVFRMGEGVLGHHV